MQTISHFTHALLMFIAPLSFLGYKPTIRQKILFTSIYGLGVNLSRRIYNFYSLPFGIHIFILIILYTILLKKILKDFSWQMSTLTSLIMFIILLINDSLILLPIMKTFNITIGNLQEKNFLVFLISILLSDLSLILAYIVGYFKNKNDKQVLLSE